MVPILNDMEPEDFEYFSLALMTTDPAVTLNPATAVGRTYFGVKWQILPLCIKGKFYAIHVFVHKGKILRHGCRYVHNDSILRHGVWRKIPL